MIAQPDAYDGKRIVLRGFVNLEFEGNAIYLSEELQRYGNPRDAIWLDVAGLSRSSTFRRGYALVEGLFEAGPGGHFGMFSGTITQITRLESMK